MPYMFRILDMIDPILNFSRHAAFELQRPIRFSGRDKDSVNVLMELRACSTHLYHCYFHWRNSSLFHTLYTEMI